MTAAISVGTGLAISAGVAATGAVVGGVLASKASGKAADAQRDAAQSAENTQLSMYNTTRDDQAPYRQAGYTALNQLSQGTAPGGQFDQSFDASKFQTDPGYQFRLAQGQRGIDASASARGGVLSGAAIKGAADYNQNFASNEYQNAYSRFNNDQSTRFNRLASVAGLGQTSTAQTGAVGANAANQISGEQIGAGNAQAAGYIGQSNAVNNTASTLGNYYLQRQYALPSSPQAMNASSYGNSGVIGDSQGFG